MRYREYMKLKELLSLVKQVLGRASDRKDIIAHISDSLALINSLLERETHPPLKTIRKIHELQRFLGELDSGTEYCDDIFNEIELNLEEEIQIRLKVVFLPYKVSMWDSLESIYFATLEDDTCDVQVVPIPYYKLSGEGAEPCYEGDLFPPEIPITHYSAYDIEADRPDIIFVHNIYDRYNTLTRVFDQYHTHNLKKYTDMLVYVPYCLFTFVPPQPSSSTETIAYGLPSVANVDKVVLLGDYLANAAVKFGIPTHKVLPLGSPKVDKLRRLQETGVCYPKGWNQKIKGKTVFLLDTHLSFFSIGALLDQVELLIKLLNIPNFVENSVLIWRPHPLLAAFLKKQSPMLLNYYNDLVRRIGENEYSNVIFDDSPDYFPALMAANVYIGINTSLMVASLLSEKPIVLLTSRLEDDSLVSPDTFYYVSEESWMERLKDLSKGVDPKALKRKGALEGIYSNIDGTSGQKILNAVKEALFMKYESKEGDIL
ncbi:MAG: hypothetical protein GX248_05360 [Peptococcaceae bacterium]|nr:hypothetical protein [Peptococcaceae bacterium]